LSSASMICSVVYIQQQAGNEKFNKIKKDIIDENFLALYFMKKQTNLLSFLRMKHYCTACLHDALAGSAASARKRTKTFLTHWNLCCFYGNALDQCPFSISCTE